MGDVIEFSGEKRVGTEQALQYFRSAYLEAGLSPAQVAWAVKELEPFVRQAFPRKEFAFNLPRDLGFTEEQVEAITDEHNRCMQEAISYFGEQIWLSLCNLAGVIGRSAQDNA